MKPGKKPRHPSGRTVRHTLWMAPADRELLRRLSEQMQLPHADIVAMGLQIIKDRLTS